MTPARSRVRRLLAVFALAVTVAASSCATQRPPAAVVDGHEIPQGELERILDSVFHDPEIAREIHSPGGEERRKEIVRSVLGFMIREYALRDFARERGIRVETAEIDRAVQDLLDQVGGIAALERVLARRHLTQSDVRQNLERNLLFQKIQERVAGTGLASGQRFDDWVVRLMKRFDVRVNPRFGEWDAEHATVVPMTSTA